MLVFRFAIPFDEGNPNHGDYRCSIREVPGSGKLRLKQYWYGEPKLTPTQSTT